MIEFQPNRYIKELSFGYNAEMKGYTNLSLGITNCPKLARNVTKIWGG
jgi:hypothetical protein